MQAIISETIIYLETQKTGLLLLEPLKSWIRLSTVDINLSENWEGHAIVDLAERLNLVVASWVLTPKLITGKAKDSELVW